MSTLVFPVAGYAVTGSAALAGLATGAALLGRVLAALPAGALVDRWPRRRTLLWANGLAVPVFSSLAVAALAHRLTLSQLISVGFLSGLADAFISPATSAATRDVVPAADLPVAYARLQAGQHSANLIGPPLGAEFFSLVPGLPFLLDSVSYAANAWAVTRIRAPLAAPVGPSGSVRRGVAEGLVFVWRGSAIRAITCWGALVNFSTTLVMTTIVLRLLQAQVARPKIGLIETIASAAGLAGALVAPAVISRCRTGLMTILTGAVLAVAVVPMAWTTNPAVIGGLLAASYLLLPANNSGISGYVAAITPTRLQGRVSAAGSLISTALQPAAPITAGLLIAIVGGQAATLTAAACTAVSLTPLLVSRAARTLPAPVRWNTNQENGRTARAGTDWLAPGAG